MRAIFALSLCLLVANSQAFLFNGFAGKLVDYFKDVGSKIFNVGKALVSQAKDHVTGLLSDGVKAAGLALTHSLNPVVQKSPAAKREIADLEPYLEVAGKIFKPMFEGKFDEISDIVGKGIQGIFKLFHKQSRREVTDEEFVEQFEQIVSEHRRQVRSVFGDILGHLIDYGKVVVSAIHDKLDKLKTGLGMEKREVWKVKSRCSSAIDDMIKASQAKLEDKMKAVPFGLAAPGY